MVAIGSYLSDAFLAEAFVDDRVPLRLASIEASMEEEMLWVATLDRAVWELLAPAATLDPMELRSGVIHTSLIAVAFLAHRVMVPARGPPWDLLQGDREENLQNLKAGPAPDEPVSLK
eukprot:1857594-Lingulodinium_polyedra.AAC.1